MEDAKQTKEGTQRHFKSCRYLICAVILIMLLPGCCVFRKMETTTTVTTEVIDTVFTIRHDTIFNRVTVTINDTAVIETLTGRVTAYVDTITGMLTATFTGRVYDVPVQTLVRTVFIDHYPVKKKRLLRFEDKFLIAISLSMVFIFVYYRKRRN